MKKGRDDEIEREIRTHLDLEAEERVAGGMSETDARYAALRAFGSVTRTQEDVQSRVDVALARRDSSRMSATPSAPCARAPHSRLSPY